MDDLTAEQMDKEVLQALRDLALWASEEVGAEPECTPGLAKALAIIEAVDKAQPDLVLGNTSQEALDGATVRVVYK
ncbi:hypothetical protein [Denitrobaculum tricleocarpae]|uniref:Uncharacterized protein n=1 Tax=Denitrobaculum tricleocarpae TaxID=2591009 RepID=A0A545TSW8_9PROT|nr:hypothetical protein [Denitrobaculum tricleocarpae]TQV80308.1 hypothetical protein FKG95_08930 [Denitrobaculum tricleocarpae]